MKAVTQTFTAYVRELQAAKKDGQWSREEKKLLKAEAKGLRKEMKHDVKRAWKAKP